MSSLLASWKAFNEEATERLAIAAKWDGEERRSARLLAHLQRLRSLEREGRDGSNWRDDGGFCETIARGKRGT